MTSPAHYETLFHRHPQNPILTAADWPYPAHTVFNAGATRLQDGTTLLLCRVEDRRGHSHLCAARSLNGVDGWTIDPAPTLQAEPDKYPEELWGIEDPRITFVEELGRYAVAYTAYSRGGPGVALALTEDFRVFERGQRRCASLLPLGLRLPDSFDEDRDGCGFENVRIRTHRLRELAIRRRVVCRRIKNERQCVKLFVFADFVA